MESCRYLTDSPGMGYNLSMGAKIMKLKRFLVFGYDAYYPAGASGDQVGSYDTLQEAAEAAEKDISAHNDILDLQDRCWLEKNPKTGAWENGDR